MPGIAEGIRALGRYGDLMAILSILPVLAHVKFGSLIRAQDKLRKSKPRARAKAKADPANPGAEVAEAEAESEDEDDDMPASWTFLLLLVAEFLSALQLFDPTDKLVRRAAGDTIRTLDKSGGGWETMLGAIEKLLAGPDAYEVLRFVAVFAGTGSLFITLVLGLHKIDKTGHVSSPIRMLQKTTKSVLCALASPRTWCAVILVPAFVVGNWTAVRKVVVKPAVLELLRSMAQLLRPLAFTLTSLRWGSSRSTSEEGPVSAFCAMSVAAAVAPAARLAIYERMSIAAFFDLSKRGADVDACRAAVLMEAWSILMTLPAAVKKRRFRLLIPLLVMPCFMLVRGGPPAAMLEPYLELASRRLAMAVAMMSLFLVFMGGFPTLLLCLTLGQLLSRIHKVQLGTAKF